MKKKSRKEKPLDTFARIVAEELPFYMQKMAKAQVGPFRPPVFDPHEETQMSCPHPKQERKLNMRNEIHDKFCAGCGATISRRQASRSGACVDCQRIKRNALNRQETIRRKMKGL